MPRWTLDWYDSLLFDVFDDAEEDSSFDAEGKNKSHRNVSQSPQNVRLKKALISAR
jgi:hypothetical protein